MLKHTAGICLFVCFLAATQAAPSVDSAKAFAGQIVDAVKKSQLPVCLKLDKLPATDSLLETAKKIYLRTPVPQLLAYVSENTPEGLKQYVADLTQLSLELAKNLAGTKPPIAELKTFAGDLATAAKAFAADVSTDAPTAELRKYGKKLSATASELVSKLAQNVPFDATAVKQQVNSVTKALEEYASQLPAANVDSVKKILTELWNNQVQNADETSTVQETDEPKIDQYAANVQSAAEQLQSEVQKGDAAKDQSLRAFAQEVLEASKEFGESKALKEFSEKVWKATQTFAKKAAGALPKAALAAWTTRVAWAGAKFAAQVVWKTPGKMDAFIKPMYLVAGLKHAIENKKIPTEVELMKVKAVNFVSAAWDLTHSMYVKIGLEQRVAVFQSVPPEQWAELLKVKALQAKDTALELYTKYGPGVSRTAHAVDRVIGNYLVDFYDCAKDKGYFDRAGEAIDQIKARIAKNAAQYVPKSVLDYWRNSAPLDDWEKYGLDMNDLGSGMY